jgi:DNA-directed RNA polymerase subunit RPC12/RpoP
VSITVFRRGRRLALRKQKLCSVRGVARRDLKFRRPRRNPSEWLAEHGGTVLVAVGVASVVASLFVNSETKAVPLIVMGLAAVILGVVLPRAEGQVKVGPSGLEVVLAKVKQKAAQRGLPPETQAAAVEAATREWALYRNLLMSSTEGLAHPSESPVITNDAVTSAREIEIAPEATAVEEAAEELAESIVRKATTRVLCGECGNEIDERSDTPAEERTPCPNCGSTSRAFHVNVSD